MALELSPAKKGHFMEQFGKVPELGEKSDYDLVSYDPEQGIASFEEKLTGKAKKEPEHYSDYALLLQGETKVVARRRIDVFRMDENPYVAFSSVEFTDPDRYVYYGLGYYGELKEGNLRITELFDGIRESAQVVYPYQTPSTVALWHRPILGPSTAGSKTEKIELDLFDLGLYDYLEIRPTESRHLLTHTVSLSSEPEIKYQFVLSTQAGKFLVEQNRVKQQKDAVVIGPESLRLVVPIFLDTPRLAKVIEGPNWTTAAQVESAFLGIK